MFSVFCLSPRLILVNGILLILQECAAHFVQTEKFDNEPI